MSLKREIKKVSKLINKEGYIPMTTGDLILLLVKGNKEYYPVNKLIIKGV